MIRLSNITFDQKNDEIWRILLTYEIQKSGELLDDCKLKLFSSVATYTSVAIYTCHCGGGKC